MHGAINNLALGTLPLSKLKGASGLYNLTRNLGGAVGLATINTIMTDRRTLHGARLGEGLDASNPAALADLAMLKANLVAKGIANPDIAAMKQLSNMITQQAYVMSLADVFVLFTVLFAGLAFLALLMRKPGQAGAGGGGH